MVEEGAQVLSITENGYGKRTDIEEYRLQQRGGKGIKAMNLTDKTGLLASAAAGARCRGSVADYRRMAPLIRTPVSAISVLEPQRRRACA